MSRYIDAEKVMEEIDRIGGHSCCKWNTLGVRALIDRQSTADVVEVVRCKDCKHWVKGGYDPIICRDFGSCTCEYWEHPSEYYETSGNDFCSHGERSENGK